MYLTTYNCWLWFALAWSAASGAVVKVIIVESTLKDEDVEACLEKAIMRWKFPAPAGGGIVEVNYPFVFQQAR